MNIKIIKVEQTDSTNRYLHDYSPAEDEDMTVAVASFQTAGRGQGSNKWESEQGKNLLFSILVHPHFVPVRMQFVLSMAESLAVKEVLDAYTEGITVKWPNDIYWHDRKICGTLIECRLSSGGLKDCILGTGINVNQRAFISDAPNPVSLFQILGHDTDMDALLQSVIDRFAAYLSLLLDGAYGTVNALYTSALYRLHGFHKYKDDAGEFEAAVVEVEDDGHLVLRDRAGRILRYMFKEVKFIIPEGEDGQPNIEDNKFKSL